MNRESACWRQQGVLWTNLPNCFTVWKSDSLKWDAQTTACFVGSHFLSFLLSSTRFMAWIHLSLTVSQSFLPSPWGNVNPPSWFEQPGTQQQPGISINYHARRKKWLFGDVYPNVFTLKRICWWPISGAPSIDRNANLKLSRPIKNVWIWLPVGSSVTSISEE